MNLIANPPTPCQIGKRPPAPENRPAIEESRGGGNIPDLEWRLAQFRRAPPPPWRSTHSMNRRFWHRTAHARAQGHPALFAGHTDAEADGGGLVGSCCGLVRVRAPIPRPRLEFGLW